MTKKRDPRIDPQGGDILSVGKVRPSFRYVSIAGSRIWYGVSDTGARAARSCTLEAWQKWARNATVIQKGYKP